MFDPSETLTASSSEAALLSRISLQEQRIADALTPYEPRIATYAWFDTLRAIEELINLITVDWDDEDFEDTLLSLPVIGLAQNLTLLVAVRQHISARFDQKFCSRFTNLLLQGSAISTAFADHGIMNVAAGFLTIGTMIGYLQSRRRHFVALLHLLPTACRGQRVMAPLDTLNVFLPIIELSALQMVGAQNSLNIKLARVKLGLPECAAADWALLDSFFLEPERARIIDMSMTDEGIKMLEAMEELRPDRLFSAAELRNDILLEEAAYAEFGLKNTDYAAAAAIVRRLSTEFVDRDFWIAITPTELTSLFEKFDASPALRLALTCTASNYMACLSTYAPFVLVNDQYRSTVTLLSRFMYFWRAQCLERVKRYQVRTGFIFEDAVSTALSQQGFVVQDITRINRHEFDVVTLRNDVIWNVQCKNNFVNLSSVDSDAQRFARYNHRLVRSYEKALSKEQNREHLLKTKMSCDAVQHMVLSRFPVISNNPRIVPFSRIETFAEKANAILTSNNQHHGY